MATRYLILLLIFMVAAVYDADRAALSIAGTEIAKARVFVGCSTLIAMACYLFVVSNSKRVELQK